MNKGFVSVSGRAFIDPHGRQVTLHGMNLSRRDRGPFEWYTPQEFECMRQWGFNCARLTLSWSSIEPEPGVYDESYLREVDACIAMAKTSGVRIILDMHQDLWGLKVPGGNGAPPWATLDEGRPHNAVITRWSESYGSSQMVQTAFDNFWRNKPGPGGIGVQERFALMWKHVASRYADEPAVVGYDLFNEPFLGSPVTEAKKAIAVKMADIFGWKDAPVDSEVVDRILASERLMPRIYEMLDDNEKYAALLDAAKPVCGGFESGNLSAMYSRVHGKIREVDRQHVVFLEPGSPSSTGVESAMAPIKMADGRGDPLQAFIPHAYDIVTDSRFADQPSEKRMDIIMSRLDGHAQAMGLPMLVGEWGAFSVLPGGMRAASMISRKIEAAGSSDLYWDYSRGMDSLPLFRVLCRPYPSAIAGRIIAFSSDPSARTFSCSWKEDPAIKEPSTFYVPALWYPKGFDVSLSPDSKHATEELGGPKHNAYLLVHPAGGPVERRLVITPKE